MKEQRKRYNSGVEVKQQKNTEKQHFVLEYRSNISIEFVKKLNKIYPIQTIFSIRKLKSCIFSLKSSFDKDLKTYVVYGLTCIGCESIHVGQTSGDITTRVAECNGDKTAFKWKILDQCGQSKLMSLVSIRTLRPTTNTREKYRTPEMTLKA